MPTLLVPESSLKCHEAILNWTAVRAAVLLMLDKMSDLHYACFAFFGEEAKEMARKPTAPEIVNVLARHYGLPTGDLLRPKRDGEDCLRRRRIALYLVCKYARNPQKQDQSWSALDLARWVKCSKTTMINWLARAEQELNAYDGIAVDAVAHVLAKFNLYEAE